MTEELSNEEKLKRLREVCEANPWFHSWIILRGKDGRHYIAIGLVNGLATRCNEPAWWGRPGAMN